MVHHIRVMCGNPNAILPKVVGNRGDLAQYNLSLCPVVELEPAVATR